MVIINRHRNTGILLNEAGKMARVILMDETTLDVQEIALKTLWKDYFPLENYEDSKAARHYLKHAAGVTERAHRELNRLCGTPLSEYKESKANSNVKQRGRGVTDLIWQVADELWEAANKTQDKAAIKELRKTAVAQLIKEHSVNPTSASIGFGNWMKARLA
jgi:hypothetical protein